MFTTSVAAACALALYALVTVHGGPHMVRAVIGLKVRHHVLLVVGQAPLLLRAAPRTPSPVVLAA